MPIKDRNLQTGAVLVGRHKGANHRCEVVEKPEGVRYQVDEGEIFKSPSAAAKHVTGGAVNGWVFWSVAGSEMPQREPKARADSKAKAVPKQTPAAKKATKASKERMAKKGETMRAASKGDRRIAEEPASYECGVCGAPFTTINAATRHATEAHVS